MMSYGWRVIFLLFMVGANSPGANSQVVYKSMNGSMDLYLLKIEDKVPLERSALSFPKNLIFSMEVRAAGSDLKNTEEIHLSYDATMPEHKHGMLTKARVTRKEQNTFLIEGIKLHMPGAWLMSFKLKRGSQEDLVTIPVRLP